MLQGSLFAYSSDIAGTYYHIFRSFRNGSRGEKFETEEGLKMYYKIFFSSKSPEFYADGT